MFKTSFLTITEFIKVLEEIPEKTYVKPCKNLSEASIGQHSRHIIELYQALLKGYESGEINYDKRKREQKIELEKEFAIDQFKKLQGVLEKPNKELFLNYELVGNEIRLASNYYREIMYNLEHLVHHQALIRVAIEKETNIVLAESFGYAYATLQYKNQCLN